MPMPVPHIADTIQYATAQCKAAKAKMDEKYTRQSGRSSRPMTTLIAKCEASLYLGEEKTKHACNESLDPYSGGLIKGRSTTHILLPVR